MKSFMIVIAETMIITAGNYECIDGNEKGFKRERT